MGLSSMPATVSAAADVASTAHVALVATAANRSSIAVPQVHPMKVRQQQQQQQHQAALVSAADAASAKDEQQQQQEPPPPQVTCVVCLDHPSAVSVGPCDHHQV